MDIWHSTVFYHGTSHDEDCVGQEAAKRWAELKLRDLGYKGPVQWQCSETQCSATQSPDNTAVVALRRAEAAPNPQAGHAAAVEGPAQPTAPANYFGRLWRGEVDLPVTYWGWGFGVNLALTLLFTFVVTPGRVVGLLYLAYFAFIVVAIWRSSERYHGSKIWSALARISVMLGVIRTVVTMIAGS